ncbi:complement decay-accelerating factor-like [Dermochelys coriacea]|uniref:complement decay-accelerating factor-like n=1 Tax=Dermochelys coriacea TaxID=27794 RepID=UPI001CA8648F|nr:complement decay-accelerating factor-like [Dermochelys coriacea]
MPTVCSDAEAASSKQGRCGAPPRLSFAELQDEFKTQMYLSGTTVSYNCLPGYRRVPEELPTLLCKRESVWSEPKEFCQRKSCGHPGDLVNGKIHITDLLFGSDITFSCDKGFRLVGHDTSRCVTEGARVTWNHEIPFCEVGCQKPEVQNGSMVNALDEKMWYRVNETLPFKCSPGYQFSSHSQLPATDRFSITCLADGSWTALPKCKKQSTSDVCETVSEKELKECGVPLEMLRNLLEVQKLYLEIEKLKKELK